MAKRHERFPGNYLKKEALDGQDLTVQIDSIETEELQARDGVRQEKPVLHLTDPNVQPLVLNGENWDMIAELYGEDDGLWSGHWITLYHDPSVKFGAKRVGGIRVRKTKPVPETVSDSEPAPMPETDPAPEAVPAPETVSASGALPF